MNNHEKLISNGELQDVSLSEVDGLIKQSNNVFLPPADNPGQTTEDLLADMQHDPKFRILGYKAGDEPISYIVALSYKDPNTISIGPMFVSPECQGRGIGRKQVQDFVSRAYQQSYKKVYTKTWRNNVASRKIFESLGFHESGTKHGDRVGGDSTISYILEL